MDNYKHGLTAENIGELEVLKAPALSVYAHKVIHAFSTRSGGVSRGDYYSLNLSWRMTDDIENIKQNYALIVRALGLDMNNLVFAQQTHSANVVKVTKKDTHKGMFLNGAVRNCDALITNERGLVLAARTADCVPVLIYDPSASAVAAVHSGWKGTADNIIFNTVEAMQKAFDSRPSEMTAVIGPCIDACCYQVSKDMAELFGEKYTEVNCIKETNGVFHLDLASVCVYQLRHCGIKPESITISNECTSCCPQRFFSHRRDKGMTGGMTAFISLL